MCELFKAYRNTTEYSHDAANEYGDGRFHALWELFTDNKVEPVFGAYAIVPVDFDGIQKDVALDELLNKIDISKQNTPIGFWQFETLEARLLEKHQRAAFILASERTTKTKSTFCYDELIYCEQPSIDRFVDLISQNQIVFEFTMSEKSDGSIRNHGYPWRLNNPSLLDQLFAVRIKLR